ncbi:MAG TPA: hypothetical protein DCZ59_01340, partial [Bacteroidetes bacterium]|nr:hypothetical protein [Bacteroidota bacterium]
MTGLLGALAALLLLSREPRIDRIDPPHWWSGMGVDTLELLVEGANLTSRAVRVQGRGVSLISATAAGNSRYQYLRVQIAPNAPSQTITIIADGQPGDTALFELRQRGRRQDRIGLDQSDVMYLVMA